MSCSRRFRDTFFFVVLLPTVLTRFVTTVCLIRLHGGTPGVKRSVGHGLGSLFGSQLRSAMPLFQRGAVALGKKALKTCAHITNAVLSGQNITMAAKHRVADAGKNMLSDLLTPGVPPCKRIKHTVVTKYSREKEDEETSGTKHIRRQVRV